MALLHLLVRWRAAGATATIFAATVDHGLRPEAAVEADTVAAFAKAQNVPHEILSWEGDKPSHALQEKARAARYALLTRHARKIGADVLMTGHQADDQAETILFRLIRGSAIAGLAGMAMEIRRDGVRLARPLLECRKYELTDLCRTNNIPFHEDASNKDDRFARTRLRLIAPELEKEGLDPAAWARLGRRAARSEAALNSAATVAAARLLVASPDGSAVIDFAALATEPEEIALRVLLRGIGIVRSDASPRLERAESLLARLLNARTNGAALRSTLAGTCLSLSRHGLLHIAPEPPRTPPGQAPVG